MVTNHPMKPQAGGDWYQITVRGTVPVERESWFDGMTIRHADCGDTYLSGWLPDQAALHGLLAQIRDLGLVLIELRIAQPE